MIRQAAMIALMATTLILLASQVSIAQFIETGLPGSAFAGVVPAPDHDLLVVGPGAALGRTVRATHE